MEGKKMSDLKCPQLCQVKKTSKKLSNDGTSQNLPLSLICEFACNSINLFTSFVHGLVKKPFMAQSIQNFLLLSTTVSYTYI